MGRFFALLIILCLAPFGPVEAQDALGEYSVKANRLNVRAGPGSDNAVVAKVKRGDLVTVTAWQDGWARLTPASAAGHWVHGSFLSRVDNGPAIPAVPLKPVEAAPLTPRLPPGPEAPDAPPYRFAGITLGMSLDEFRALPPPEAAGAEGAVVICSNDEWRDDGPRPPPAPDDAESLGLSRCDLISPAKPEDERALDIRFEGIDLTPRFHFISDPDGVRRLMSVFFATDARHFGVLGHALSNALGDPVSREAAPFEDATGTVLENFEWIWTNGNSVGQLNRFWNDDQTLALELTHGGLAGLYMARYETNAPETVTE